MLLSSFTAAMMAEKLGLTAAFSSEGLLLLVASGAIFYAQRR